MTTITAKIKKVPLVPLKVSSMGFFHIYFGHTRALVQHVIAQTSSHLLIPTPEEIEDIKSELESNPGPLALERPFTTE